MKYKATALNKLQLVGIDGSDVVIMPGDTFSVYGTVVLFKNTMIDLTKYQSCFKLEPDTLASKFKYMELEFKHNVQVGDVTIPKGTKLRTMNNIMYYEGTAIDISSIESAISVREVYDVDYVVPEEPVVLYERGISPLACKKDGTLKGFTGFNGQYAATVSDGLIQMFLCPAIPSEGVFRGRNGIYQVKTDKETSIAFGITRLQSANPETDILQELSELYDIYLTVGHDVNNATILKVTPDGFQSTTDDEYLISDSVKDADTVQNATRLRFLVDGKLIEPADDMSMYAKFYAIHKKTKKSMNLEVYLSATRITPIEPTPEPTEEPTEKPTEEPTEEPVKHSVYQVTVQMPESITATQEHDFSATLKTTELGDIGYDKVRIFFETIQKPELSTVTFKLTDTLGTPFEFVDAGAWGPENGFPLPANYEVTTPFKAIFSTEGDYKFKISVKNIEDDSVIVENEVIAHANAVPAEPEVPIEPEVPEA